MNGSIPSTSSEACTFPKADAALRAEIERGAAPAAQLAIRHAGERVFSRAYGLLDPADPAHPTTLASRFDLASVTKLFTTTLFMMQVEAGRTALDAPACSVLPEFCGERAIRPYEDPLNWSGTVNVTGSEEPVSETVDAGAITFRQLLSHTSGLPAWRPLLQQISGDAARGLAIETFFSYRPGTRVIYSDVGLILLGMAVERLSGQSLAAAVRERICVPLGLERTGFNPIPNPDPWDCAATEDDPWRGRRVRGEVHDENAWRLGGAAGHAGLFSNADDLTRFGQMYLDGGRPLLRAETVAEMITEQSSEGAVRRGVGFHLWSPDPDASSRPFSPRTFGHTGFTGTCLWIDPERALVVALLTNEVYHGRKNRQIIGLRSRVMKAVVEDMEHSL